MTAFTRLHLTNVVLINVWISDDSRGNMPWQEIYHVPIMAQLFKQIGKHDGSKMKRKWFSKSQHKRYGEKRWHRWGQNIKEKEQKTANRQCREQYDKVKRLETTMRRNRSGKNRAFNGEMACLMLCSTCWHCWSLCIIQHKHDSMCHPNTKVT